MCGFNTFFKIVLFLFVASFEGKACAKGNRVVYVSSSIGSNAFSGDCEETPLRTIAMALKMGDLIMLKSGDVFYETVNLENKRITKYGGKTLPVICGLKQLVSPSWQKSSENIWKISLKRGSFLGFDTGGTSMLNNIGCIFVGDSAIHGRRVQYQKDLNEDWDIWQTNHFKKKETCPSDFDSLYLYLTEDPNKLSMALSVGATGVNLENATIDNVAIKGFGRHGIRAKTHSVIKNCRIDVIGGMTQVGYTNFVSLGNGIEFGVSSDLEDCLVENCVISRCYDCGVTIQSSNGGQATPRNVLVQHNLIFDCCQGWEDFLRNDENVKYVNCIFQNNIVLNSGKTSGFNYPKRFKYCHVLGNNFKGDKGMIIRKNVFIGGNYYCSGAYQNKYMSNIWDDNECYIQRGDFILSNYDGSKDVIRIPTEKGVYKTLSEATNRAISKYREMTSDKTTRFIIKDNKYINKQIRKIKNRYL